MSPSKRKRKPGNRVCPCGSARLYARCCGALHDGAAAQSAEALMRSRYAAFALRLVEYLMETTAPSGPVWRDDAAAWAQEVAEFCETTRFRGLRVCATGTEARGDWVEFEARLAAESAETMKERSLFVRPDGRWLYWGPLG